MWQRLIAVGGAMIQDLDLQIVGQIFLAVLLGGAVGLERQIHKEFAGLRTHILICVGSALFTILSDRIARSFGGDPLRIAAQLVTGIGFIGAGAILRDQGSIHGLTTATSIFVVSSIG